MYMYICIVLLVELLFGLLSEVYAVLDNNTIKVNEIITVARIECNHYLALLSKCDCTCNGSYNS